MAPNGIRHRADAVKQNSKAKTKAISAKAGGEGQRQYDTLQGFWFQDQGKIVYLEAKHVKGYFAKF